MVIEKVEKKSYEFSKAAITQLAIAGGLVLLAIPVGWFAFSNWRFKSSLVAGFQEFESGPSMVGAAKSDLESAVSWKPDHAGAHQVLAKIFCDGGGTQLAAAEDHLKRARAAGSDTSDLKVAMGVINLKRAEQAKTPKEAAAFIDAAAKEFGGAGSPEGAVGLGHCELLLANRTGDAARLQAAKKRFEAVRDDLAKRGISPGGLIDYYSGLGTALASSDKDQDLKDARDAFQACAQLARGWEVPRANLMVAEARRWMLWKGSAAEINSTIPETDLKRKVLGNYWREHRDPTAREKLARPWALWSIAYAQALSRAGNDKDATRIIGELKSISQLEAVPDAYLADAALHCEMATRPNLKPNEQDSAVSQALSALDSLVKKHLGNPTDDVAKDRKARAMNALAVMRFMQGPAYYKQAEDFLNEALKLYPDDYIYNRNLVIVLKRSKAPTAKIQPALDKAKAAGTGALAEDFDKVQKVLEER